MCVMGNWQGLGENLRDKRGNTPIPSSPAFCIRALDVTHLTCGFLVFTSLLNPFLWLISYQALKSQASFNRNFSFSGHAQYSSLTPCRSYHLAAELNNLPEFTPSEIKACLQQSAFQGFEEKSVCLPLYQRAMFLDCHSRKQSNVYFEGCINLRTTYVNNIFYTPHLISRKHEKY